jgi:hypothetical protein
MGYKYSVSYAPSGRAQCRKCGQMIKQDSLRISRESGPVEHFGDAGIVNHFHFKHAFDAMEKGRCTSSVPSSPSSFKGFNGLLAKDKKRLTSEVKKFSGKWSKKCSGKMRKSTKKQSLKKTKSLSRKRRSSHKRRTRRRSRH